ncbi:lytic transglycosylase domain-containing protein [Shewanella sp. TC10]|uniref:lytic transglycosylase domain-containing protein n=1 Tax=Shewanella sp. TC10 TaxID=1419739 RepID=UPI003A7F277E
MSGAWAAPHLDDKVNAQSEEATHEKAKRIMQSTEQSALVQSALVQSALVQSALVAKEKAHKSLSPTVLTQVATPIVTTSAVSSPTADKAKKHVKLAPATGASSSKPIKQYQNVESVKPTWVSSQQPEVKQAAKSQQVLLAPIVVLPTEPVKNQDVESRLHLKPKKQQVLHPAVVAIPDDSPKPMLVLQPKVLVAPTTQVDLNQKAAPAKKTEWVKPLKTASFSDSSQTKRSQPKRKIYQYEQGGITTFSNIVPDSTEFEVLLYDCFACQVDSQVDWHSIPLFAFKHKDYVSDAAQQFALDPALIRAVIHAESAFNAKALSKVGAIGLMQLMPATAKELGVSDAYDVKQNIWGGSQYLAYLLDRFDNDIDLACAAYNAGPTTVSKYQGIPPYPETQAYVERVKILLKRYRAALQS